MSSAERVRQFLHEYRALMILGSAALLAELAYAILNLSAMPMYVDKGLHQFSHYGVIFGTFLAAEAVSRPALGALGDRIGRKPLMVTAPAITAATSYLTILVGGPYVVTILIVLRAIDGVGSSALWMNAFASIGDIVGEKHRSAAMSVLNVTYMGGMALGFLLGGGANDLFGTLHASFYLASILFILAFLVMLVFFPHDKPHHVDLHLEELAHPVELVKEAESKLIRKLTWLVDWLKSVFLSFREVPDMVVMAVVTFLGMGLLTPIVKVYAFDHLNMSETTFGLFVAPIAAAMGIFAVPLGHIGDRFGKATAVCWGLLASSLAMWLIALFRINLLIAFAGVLIGLGFTVAFPAWNALVISSTDARKRGEVLGAVGFAQGIAAMVGTLVGPVIYKSEALSLPRLGIVNYNLPFWISAVMISAGTVICFTWVANERALGAADERLTFRQRTLVIAAAIAGLIGLVAWIGWRYTMPVRPERVAWSWVQQVARNRPEKAHRFAIASAPGWDARAEEQRWGPTLHRWVYEEGAGYTVRLPSYKNRNRATALVMFNFPGGGRRRFVTIDVCRNESDGEWKVCGIRQEQ